ncbi:MAG: hypothetical protein IT210_06410 [Armatimonadetes bacterium]|nr:hypothetical protein [Armatimonadota bacterium]
MSAIAIFQDDAPAVGCASSPETLAAVLRADGHSVVFMNADDLARVTTLAAGRVDILVLPYGATFPAHARRNLERFLSRGGGFLSMGGYAFDNPVVRTGSGWRPEAESALAGEGEEQVAFGSFDASLQEIESAGWSLKNEPFCGLEGGGTACVRVPEDAWWQGADFSFDAPAGEDAQRYLFTARARWEAVDARHGGCAFLKVEQLTSRGDPVGWTWTDVARLTGSGGWKTFARSFAIGPRTAWLRVRFGLKRASGTLQVQNLSLTKRGPDIRINTGKGWTQDALEVKPGQIGVFDPDYRLRRVACAQAASGQFVFPEGLRLDGAMEGFAASGVLGQDNSRWIPLLNAYDRYGRLRGSAGSLMYLYNGPYRGSAWAFFGVTDRDLFASETGPMADALKRLVQAMSVRTFLHNLNTDCASYEQGEPVRIAAKVSNFGRQMQEVLVVLSVADTEGTAALFTETVSLRVRAGHTAAVSSVWQPERFERSRYRVRAVLKSGGADSDAMDCEFTVWNPQLQKSGFPMAFRDNYFRAGSRAWFLQGTDDYAHTFNNAFEGPQTWYRDVVKCRDFGIDVYENLQGGLIADYMGQSGQGSGYEGARRWWRQIDAMVQGCMEAGAIYFPGLLIGANTAVTDEELAAQADFCRRFAERYRDASGIVYYLNGDLQLRLTNIPDLKALYNEYLRAKYKTDEALKAAWRLSPPERPIGDIDIGTGTNDWEDLRTFDDFFFRTRLTARWLNALYDGVRQADTEHPVTAEFYQGPWAGIDLVTGIGKLEVANIGYFDVSGDDIYKFPQTLKFIDLRARGKSLNIGEFGVKTHPAWEDSGGYIHTRPESEEREFFLGVGHYAVGLGASKIHNWCWKYPADRPFEWGVNYPCDDVERDVLYIYRNNGFFFKRYDFIYESPSVFFVIAGNHRMGGRGEDVRQAQLNGIRLLLDAHIDIGSIDEEHLDALPESAKVLVYPLPFCPDDAAFEKIAAFVEGGGTLYLSGDITYDTSRQRTRTDRLERLCGVRFVEEQYRNLDYEPHPTLIAPARDFHGLPEYEGYPCIRIEPAGAEVAASDAEGNPVVVTHRAGKGRVFYSTDPLELHASARLSEAGHTVYRAFLRWAGVEGNAIASDDRHTHLFRLHTAEGETVRILCNRYEEALAREVSLEGDIALTLGARLTGAVVTDDRGRVTALEAGGKAAVKGRLYLESDMQAMAFSQDGQDLRSSQNCVLMPMLGEGRLFLGSDAPWQSPEAAVGEFRGGQWRTLEILEPSRNGDGLTFSIDADRATCILLVGESADREERIRQFTDTVRPDWRGGASGGRL